MSENPLINFFYQLYNGLDSIPFPMVGFTGLTVWKFLVGLFFLSFIYFVVKLLLVGSDGGSSGGKK